QAARISLGEPQWIVRMARRGIQGETVMGLATFSGVGSGEIPLSALGTVSGPMPWIPGMRILYLADDLSNYREVMERYRRIAAMPYHMAGAELAQASDDIIANKRRGLFTSLLLPSLNTAIQRLTIADANNEAARAGLALAQFRLDKG